MCLTTSQPCTGHVINTPGDVLLPVLSNTLATTRVAHGLAVTPGGRCTVVQNVLSTFPGMNDGAITVIDLRAEEVAGQIDTLKDAGLTNNDIILLPPWNRPLGG